VTQLSGFLRSQKINAESYDLSLEATLKIFSATGLSEIFANVSPESIADPYDIRLWNLKHVYTRLVGDVIRFLQGKENGLSYLFSKESFIPQGYSFAHSHYAAKKFGNHHGFDQAKFYCSLFIDDLTRFIRNNVTPHFGLSRYAEKISISAASFQPFIDEIGKERNVIEIIMLRLLENKIISDKPLFAGFTIPFPGNLLSALISADFLKKNFPEIKIAFGGGYVNTELRLIKDKRLFDYIDFLTFDDGELPLLNIIKNLTDQDRKFKWVRTLTNISGTLSYFDNAANKIHAHNSLVPPSLVGIDPGNYISVTETTNPMHSLWSDGYWNKLATAHGCYWKKCTFCDISLDYIGRYDPAKAQTIVNWMEDLIGQTGIRNFHFIDEAAPPSLLREVAIEILRRELNVTWWGNIRFEKAFTIDLCRLLSLSGCIAVSGGIEVADDRLLKLINKGVTVGQVAKTCRNFSESGIMIHSYLMFGFPSQTEQEIINSLDLVRQFFLNGLFTSGFWHQFALTTHSPVAANPDYFGVRIKSSRDNPFANNDLAHDDNTGLNYSDYYQGLNLALSNYLNGSGMDKPVNKWFDQKMPPATVKKNHIRKLLDIPEPFSRNQRILWVATKPAIRKTDASSSILTVHLNDAEGEWVLPDSVCRWVKMLADQTDIQNYSGQTLDELAEYFPGGIDEFRLFQKSDTWTDLRGSVILLL